MKNSNNSKKSSMLIDCYTQPIFPTHNIYVVRHCDKDEIHRRFEYCEGKPLDLDDSTLEGATYYGVIEKDTRRFCIVVILADDVVEEYQKDLVEAIKLCSHEAFHAVFRILLQCDINLDESTNEVYAYFVGWVSSCIMETLMKSDN